MYSLFFLGIMKFVTIILSRISVVTRLPRMFTRGESQEATEHETPLRADSDPAPAGESTQEESAGAPSNPAPAGEDAPDTSGPTGSSTRPPTTEQPYYKLRHPDAEPTSVLWYSTGSVYHTRACATVENYGYPKSIVRRRCKHCLKIEKTEEEEFERAKASSSSTWNWRDADDY